MGHAIVCTRFELAVAEDGVVSVTFDLPPGVRPGPEADGVTVDWRKQLLVSFGDALLVTLPELTREEVAAVRSAPFVTIARSYEDGSVAATDVYRN